MDPNEFFHLNCMLYVIGLIFYSSLLDRIHLSYNSRYNSICIILVVLVHSQGCAAITTIQF